MDHVSSKDGLSGHDIIADASWDWPIAVAYYPNILLLNQVDGNERTNHAGPVAVDMNNEENLINQCQSPKQCGESLSHSVLCCGRGQRKK